MFSKQHMLTCIKYSELLLDGKLIFKATKESPNPDDMVSGAQV